MNRIRSCCGRAYDAYRHSQSSKWYAVLIGCLVFPGAAKWTAERVHDFYANATSDIGDNFVATIFSFCFRLEMNVRIFTSISANMYWIGMTARLHYTIHNSVYQFEFVCRIENMATSDSFTCHVSFSIQLCEPWIVMELHSRRIENEYLRWIDIRYSVSIGFADRFYSGPSACPSFAFCLYIYCCY